MAGARSPWRALRPVLLAGAATLTWLTFSSPAASADVLQDTSSLLGDATNAVSFVTGQLSSPVLPSAPSQPPGALRPVVASVSGLIDSAVTAVPVVKHVVPPGTVSAVAVPVAGFADGATGELVHVVAPPVAKVLPVLEPVLQPVTDLVTGTKPLPAPLPDKVTGTAPLPGQVTDVTPLPGPGQGTANPGTTIDPSSPQAGHQNGAAATPDEETSADAYGDPRAAAQSSEKALSGPEASQEERTFGQWATASAVSPTGGPSNSLRPVHIPGPVPGGPASGAGSGTSASGGSGSFGSLAWLHAYSLLFPLSGATNAGDAVCHAPSPVSFDPGSSPD